MDELARLLENTGIFTHFWWDRPPACGDYGVYAENGANDLEADGRHIERATSGTIDLFCRSDESENPASVESILESVECCAWYLTSIQYEEETGLVHYEWAFEVA